MHGPFLWFYRFSMISRACGNPVYFTTKNRFFKKYLMTYLNLVLACVWMGSPRLNCALSRQLSVATATCTNTLMINFCYSMWVWFGNTTITNCRQRHGIARKSDSTITGHQEDKAKQSNQWYCITFNMVSSCRWENSVDQILIYTVFRKGWRILKKEVHSAIIRSTAVDDCRVNRYIWYTYYRSRYIKCLSVKLWLFSYPLV